MRLDLGLVLSAALTLGVAAPAHAGEKPLAKLNRVVRAKADRLINQTTVGGRAYLAQFAVEKSRAAESALRAHYGVPAKNTRLSWTATLDLRRDAEPTVDTAAVTQHLTQPVSLVTHVNELLHPDVEQHLRAKGFRGGRGEDAMRNRLTMSLSVKDPEIEARLGYAGASRYAQRISVHYEKDKPVAAYVLSYSFPPRGMPGVNEENIRYSVYESGQTEIERVLMNTSLEHTVALPWSVNLDFDKRAD